MSTSPNTFDSVVNLRISEAESAQLKNRVAEIVGLTPFTIIDDIKDKIARDVGCALKDILATSDLEAIQKLSASGGASVLNGIGFPSLADGISTPFTGFSPQSDRAVVVADAIILGLFDLLQSSATSFQNENHGRIVRNVVANPSSSTEYSSHGSRLKFSWHVDNPQYHFDFQGPNISIPRYLGFYGMRNQEKVPTKILLLERLLSQLDPNTIHHLIRPVFNIASPDSNDAENDQNSPLLSIIAYDEDGVPNIRYEKDKIHTEDSDAAAALERLSTALDKEIGDISLTLESDSVLIIDNYRVLHERPAFVPFKDLACSRWLRRIYGKRVFTSDSTKQAMLRSTMELPLGTSR